MIDKWGGCNKWGGWDLPEINEWGVWKFLFGFLFHRISKCKR